MNKKLLKQVLEYNTPKLFDLIKDAYPHADITEHNGLKLCYIDNGSNVLGVCHADTVHRGGKLPRAMFSPGIVSTISLDDRLGVYALLFDLELHCDILITDGEESGQSTARHFYPTKQYNWCFELDRHGTDVVCYQYDCMEMIASDYFEVGYGSYSDICDLEQLNCLCVNVGIGYYNEHTDKCFAVLAHYNSQLTALRRMYADITEHLPFYDPDYDYDNIWEENKTAFNDDMLIESEYFIK